MTERPETNARPWFVRHKGPGRWQIRPYGRGGWAVFLGWMTALYGGGALLFLPFFRGRPWIVGAIWLAATAAALAIALKTYVRAEDLPQNRDRSGR